MEVVSGFGAPDITVSPRGENGSYLTLEENPTQYSLVFDTFFVNGQSGYQLYIEEIDIANLITTNPQEITVTWNPAQQIDQETISVDLQAEGLMLTPVQMDNAISAELLQSVDLINSGQFSFQITLYHGNLAPGNYTIPVVIQGADFLDINEPGQQAFLQQSQVVRIFPVVYIVEP